MKAVHLIGSLDDQQDPIFGSLIHNTRIQWWGHSVACVASVLVWFRSKERPKNNEEWDFRVWLPEKWGFDKRSSFFAQKPHGNGSGNAC